MKKILAFLMAFLLLFISQSFVIGEEVSELAIMTNIDYRKHIVQYTYMDQDDQIVSGPYGYAIIECQYDGNKEYPTKVRYLDASGQRVENLDGYSVVKFNYDGRKNLTEAILVLRDEDIQEAGLQLYQIIPFANALISDYSSISIDYLLLNKPIVFTLDDYEQYEKSRGLYPADARNYMPGYHVYNSKDVKKALLEISNGIDLFVDDRRKMCARYHKYKDGDASKRIIEMFGI